jgi:hypothetical protein
VAAAFDPFVVLFGQDCADEADQGGGMGTSPPEPSTYKTGNHLARLPYGFDSRHLPPSNGLVNRLFRRRRPPPGSRPASGHSSASTTTPIAVLVRGEKGLLPAKPLTPQRPPRPRQPAVQPFGVLDGLPDGARAE